MAPKKISKSSISAPTATTVTATAYKYQLPALDIPRASLAEGTPIPPPQREPTPPISPPQTPLSRDSPNPLRSHPTSSHSLTRKFSGDAATKLNGHNRASPAPTNTSQLNQTTSQTNAKRSFTASPASTSPPPSKRPHIRKLLSLRSLANLNRSSAELPKLPTYSESGYTVDIRSQSPSPSTSTSMSTISKLKKRGSGAFWRRGSGFGFGLGLVTEENEGDAGRKSAPPRLPELDVLEENPTSEQNKRKSGVPVVRRQASGWFGGERMFDGIGRG